MCHVIQRLLRLVIVMNSNLKRSVYMYKAADPVDNPAMILYPDLIYLLQWDEIHMQKIVHVYYWKRSQTIRTFKSLLSDAIWWYFHKNHFSTTCMWLIKFLIAIHESQQGLSHSYMYLHRKWHFNLNLSRLVGKPGMRLLLTWHDNN